MGKLAVFIFILFLAALALFAIFNQEVTTIQIPFGTFYETPTITLILMSVAIGGLGMLLMFIIRDTKRYDDSWQYQKKQKSEAKVRDLYAKALHNLFVHHNQTEAREFFQEALKEDPEHLNTLLQLGDIAMAEDDFQKARAYYQQAWFTRPKQQPSTTSPTCFCDRVAGRMPSPPPKKRVPWAARTRACSKKPSKRFRRQHRSLEILSRHRLLASRLFSPIDI